MELVLHLTVAEMGKSAILDERLFEQILPDDHPK
jgi:hypothetical protein